MKKSNLLVICLGIICVNFIAIGTANASILTYTDRTSWETAVSNWVTEDFNALSDTAFSTGINSAGALTVSITGPPLSNMLKEPSGGHNIDGTRFLQLNQDSSGGTDVDILFPHLITAFAADWDSTLTADFLNILIAGTTIRFNDYFSAPGDGFLGFVSSIPFASISFGTDAGGLEGFAIDNVGFSGVPEPSTMILLGFGLLGLAGVNRRKR